MDMHDEDIYDAEEIIKYIQNSSLDAFASSDGVEVYMGLVIYLVGFILDTVVCFVILKSM